MIDQFVGAYRFLSNFYPSKVLLYGDVFPTVEHAFQAAKWPPIAGDKWLNYEHQKRRDTIQVAETPGLAKKIGGSLELPPRQDWDEFRVQAMRMLLERKFEDDRLARLLVATEDHELVEGNNHNDPDWGAILVRPDGVDRVYRKYRGAREWRRDEVGVLIGVNMLGRLLMGVRAGARERVALVASS